MTIKNHDRYYDPPDEPEVPLCESCGHEMNLAHTFTYKDSVHFDATCVNPLCPNKHTGIAKEMAEKIVELTEELDEYKLRVRVLKNKLDTVSNYNKEK